MLLKHKISIKHHKPLEKEPLKLLENVELLKAPVWTHGECTGASSAFASTPLQSKNFNLARWKYSWLCHLAWLGTNERMLVKLSSNLLRKAAMITSEELSTSVMWRSYIWAEFLEVTKASWVHGATQAVNKSLVRLSSLNMQLYCTSSVPGEQPKGLVMAKALQSQCFCPVGLILL